MIVDTKTSVVESGNSSSDESCAELPIGLKANLAKATPVITSQDDVGPPPDGGLNAWLQVVAGHLTVFNSWGYLISFGIFQAYYTRTLNIDPSAVSWIGSTQICLIFLIGTFSGRAFDAGHYILTLQIGFLLQLIGIFTTSCATKYWQFYLAQGLCQGLGCGLVFAPAVANLGTYFSKNKSMAVSMAACGGATGGLVFPAIAKQMLPRVGFAWTMRIMGLVMLVNCIIVLVLTKPRLPPRKAGPLIEVEAFKEPTYLLFCIGMFFTLWAVYFGYYYARSYALDRLSGTQAVSFSMLMIINGLGVPGRLVPAFLADRYFGAMPTMVPTIFGAAIVVFSWIAVPSLTGDYVWVIAFGYFGSGIQGMFPATCAGLSKDLSKSGTRIGMIFTIISFACLTGPPLAGKLIQIAGGRYIAAQIWGGSCLTVGGFLVTGACWANRPREKLNEREEEMSDAV
ncbi:MFS-type transporter [Cladobotryum mycophilum]|uniref:MFS-type transporter n=1 Tax=Cladobotryum mycophilum TaxID=491253 RepID=A0ABR0SJA3_9HYPO